MHPGVSRRCSGALRLAADVGRRLGAKAREQPGEATKAAKICFKAWLVNRGGTQSQERIQALKQVKTFIEAHGESRFTNLDEDGMKPRTINRVGYSKQIYDDTIYYFFAESFKKEVCKGIDHKVVLAVLKEKGALIHEHGRLTTKFQLPDKRRTRGYAVNWGVLVDE